MGGQSKATQQTQQQSTTAPWGPTQPLLNSALGNLGAQPTALNPTQQAGITGLTNSANMLPDYTPQATALTSQLFNGTPNFSQPVSDATSQFQKSLTPYAQGAYLDPTQAPGMQNVLDTIRSDVSNSVNGQFAGAGRDLSGANTQALARGISQGEATPLLNQYATNQGIQQNAISNLFQGGILGANTLSGLYQTGLGNQLTGLATAPTLGTANAGANAQLQAGNTAAALPYANISNLLNLLLPIAGLGGQSTGQSQTQGTNQMSGAQQFGLISGGLGSLFGGAGKAAAGSS